MNKNNWLTAARSVLVLWLTLNSGYLFAGVNCGSGLSCTQTIELKPGWNSIFVQVDPDIQATEQLFADMLDGSEAQISSVWTWLAHRAKIDFIQDPDPDNLLSAPGWLRFFPDQSKQAFMTNLHAIQGNRAYLVKLEGDQNVTLGITGTAVVPRINWEPGSFNHLGFHVDPANLPTFKDFFAASPAHDNQAIYQLISDVWVKVDPLNAIIQPDVAYWVFSKAGSDYTGPIQVELPLLDRLEYGDVLTEFIAKLKNRAVSAQSVSVQVLGNPAGLYYPNPDLAATNRWLPLPAPLIKDIGIGGEARIPLGIRRADFHLGNYNHILQVTSAAGSRWLIPVTASAPQLNSLWVGSVRINKVSQVQNYQHNCIETKTKKLFDSYDEQGEAITLSYDEFAPNMDTAGTGYGLCRDENGFPTADNGQTVTPVGEGAEFSFRVILHREGSQVRLLKDVIQMYDSNLDADGNPKLDADGNVIPGRYVLLTDDSLIPSFDGITIRDGEIVGRRISSMAYDFPGNSYDMNGSLDSTLSTTLPLVLAADAPTNPFRHHYHNDHKDSGYQVTRQMIFENVDLPAQSGQPTYPLSAGREVIDGTYTETITGLHKNSIIVEGTYILRHAVAVNTLNQ